MKEIKSILWVLIIVKSFLYCILIPPWLGNDEPLHFESVFLYAFPGEDKSIQKEIIDSMIKTDAWKRADRKEPPQGTEFFKDTDLKILGASFNEEKPPLYYFLTSFPIKIFSGAALEKKLFIARLFTAFLSLVTLLVIYKTAVLIFGKSNDGSSPLAVLGFTAFHPQFSFLSGIVNSDGLAILICTLIFYYAIRLIDSGELSLDFFITVIVLIGLGLLTKRHIFFTTVPIAYLVTRYIRKGNVNEVIGIMFRLGLILFSTVLLFEIVGLWMPDKMISSIDQLTNLPIEFNRNYDNSFVGLGFKQLFTGMGILFVTFWFSYGEMVNKMNFGWYFIFLAITLVPFLGIIKTLFHSVESTEERKTPKGIILKFSLIYLVTNFLLVISAFSREGTFQLISGRYLFYSISPLAVLFVIGMEEIFGKSMNLGICKWILAMSLIVNFYSIYFYLIPIYYL